MKVLDPSSAGRSMSNLVTSKASDTILKTLIFISVNMNFSTHFPVKYRQFLNYNTLLPC